MTAIVTILTEGYADWETAFINAAANTYFGIKTHFATPDGWPVTSAAGLRVTPDMAMVDIDMTAFDALLINGGTIWQTEAAPNVTSVVRKARAADKVIAGICDGTFALARTGLLDDVAHTSNSPDNLTPTGYKGAAHYVDQPQALTAGKVITAPGTAPVTFMAAVLDALGYRNNDLDFYVDLYGKEHATPPDRHPRA